MEHGGCRIVLNATVRAASRPFEVAAAITCDADVGSAWPMSSIGRPSRLEGGQQNLDARAPERLFAEPPLQR